MNEQMITLHDRPVALVGGAPVPVLPGMLGCALDEANTNASACANMSAGANASTGASASACANVSAGANASTRADIGSGTIAYKLLNTHNRGNESGKYKIKFDALISHDITYVGIIQTARASGMTSFPVPYALTNCHNSLCAVGGTINEDDHVFGLSAARKYGGIFVPANQAVIHQYAREALAVSGGMILGSDSHTRYGALGAMGIGEGGPELVKQLLGNTYDINAPEVVLVWLENAPPRGVGPHDIAIALCGAVYDNGFARNKILEFAGPGLAYLPIDFRFGIDVMTTETACLSSIWRTDDEVVSSYYMQHGRKSAYTPLAPDDGAVYGSMVRIDLSKAEPMIAMPFHPSNAFSIKELNLNAADILREAERSADEQFGGRVNLSLTDKVKCGRVMTDQGIIAGCAGGMYDNIREAAAILSGASIGDGAFSLSVYPSSMPVNLQLIDDGIQGGLIRAGAIFKPCFCGPCFGAGDVPSNNGFSIRHTTRNFVNREGSRPGDGQLACVALMDARSIAATAKNCGALTSAAEIEYERVSTHKDESIYSKDIYANRIYNGYGSPRPDVGLVLGPNIADWPQIDPLGENLLLRIASVIRDPVTTTDELIPSGETSSYRSNPQKLAEFALSRRDPQYVGRAKAIRGLEASRKQSMPQGGAQCEAPGRAPGGAPHEVLAILKCAAEYYADIGDKNFERIDIDDMFYATQIASAIFANNPGDGSAREQAASCQRVLGGGANICYEYATKRYRSNLINWGILPFTLDPAAPFAGEPGDWIFVPGVREILAQGSTYSTYKFDALLIKDSIINIGQTPDIPSVNQHRAQRLMLQIGALTPEERDILLLGCLMNYYAAKKI